MELCFKFLWEPCCRDKDQDTGDEEVVEENEEEDEDGEIKEKKDTGQQGPWNVKSTPAPAVSTKTPGKVIGFCCVKVVVVVVDLFALSRCI